MMYKFMEMPDSTEITHSEMREDGSVKRDAEITGGYMTTEVTEKKLSLEK